MKTLTSSVCTPKFLFSYLSYLKRTHRKIRCSADFGCSISSSVARVDFDGRTESREWAIPGSGRDLPEVARDLPEVAMGTRTGVKITRLLKSYMNSS